MKARWKKWSVVATLLVLVAAVLGWCMARPGPEVQVQLRLLSYTNESVRPVLSYNYEEGEVSVVPSSYAFVLATNSGAVAVQLHAGFHGTNLVNVGGTLRDRDGFVRPSRQNLPLVLKPGEWIVLKIGPSHFSQPWSTEILGRRYTYGLRDRMYNKAMATGKPMLQKWASRLLASRTPFFITLGPITNLPPQSATPDLPRVARP